MRNVIYGMGAIIPSVYGMYRKSNPFILSRFHLMC
jgi:hypothetical protein